MVVMAGKEAELQFPTTTGIERVFVLGSAKDWGAAPMTAGLSIAYSPLAVIPTGTVADCMGYNPPQALG